MTESPTWKPPISSGCTKQLRQLSLTELLEWADRDDVMICELVRRIEELRSTNGRIQTERCNAYGDLNRALETVAQLRRQLARFYGTEEHY